MKKSEKLKKELKTLTDSSAVRLMKQRISLAEAKEKSEAVTLYSQGMKVVISLNKTIDLYSEELMAIDHDEEVEKVKEINGIIENSISIKNDMLKILESIKKNNL